MKDGTEARVAKLPPCDIDPSHGPAGYDAKTTEGPWGYLCEPCFAVHGVGLGTGLGQRLVVTP